MSLQAHICIHMHLLGGGSHNKTICEAASSKATYHLAFESGHYDALLNPYVAMKRKRATDIRDYGHRVFEDVSGLTFHLCALFSDISKARPNHITVHSSINRFCHILGLLNLCTLIYTIGSTHAYTHSYICAHHCICLHAYTHACKHAYTNTDTHVCAHVRTCVCTHIYTHV